MIAVDTVGATLTWRLPSVDSRSFDQDGPAVNSDHWRCEVGAEGKVSPDSFTALKTFPVGVLRGSRQAVTGTLPIFGSCDQAE
jgi:hypothetical protein